MPDSANFALKAFRQDGIVEIRDGQVSINMLRELVRIAEPLLDAHERVAPEFVAEAGARRA